MTDFIKSDASPERSHDNDASDTDNTGCDASAATPINGEVSKFLNALFGGYEGALPFGLRGELVNSRDPGFIAENYGALSVRPANEDGVFFLVGKKPGNDRDAWENCRTAPTAALFRDGMSIFCWAFPEPIPLGDPVVTDLMVAFDMLTLEEAIPLPGTDRWELAHVNEDNSYRVSDLADAYLDPIVMDREVDDDNNEDDDEEEAAPITVNDGPVPVAMYGEAKVITAYDEKMYDGKSIDFAIGASQFSKNWVPQKLPLAGLIHQFTRHQIGKKDGAAVVFADMVKGQRVKKAVKACSAIGLDIDTGTPSAVVDRAIAKLGCLAIRTTTHSHGKQNSELNKDKILRFRPEADEIDTELCRDFLRNKEFWDESIVKTVKYIEEDHTEKGMLVRVSHAPMPKHRVIVPVEKYFVIADQGRTQQEAMSKWAKVPEALATRFGVPFDRSCTDPSRLFYTPRHDKGRPYEVSLFGGPLFDLDDLSLTNAFDAVAAEVGKRGSKSVTLEGRNLGRFWMKAAHGFQIMDVIEQYAPDRKRSKATNGYNIECPFDSDHSNSGDTTDQACFAVNAADGSNEYFVIKCQHETCKDKTALDMLGKMIKDEWFDKEVLEDESFNIAEPDDASALTKQKNSADTFEAVQAEVEGLKKPISPNVLKRLREIVEAWDDAWEKGILQKQIAQKTGVPTETVRKTTKKKSVAKKSSVDENATLIFDCMDKPDHVSVRDAFFDHIPAWNGTNDVVPSRQRQPLLTCLLDAPYQLRITDGVARFVQLNPVSFRALSGDMMILRKVDDQGNHGPREFISRDLTDVIYNGLWKFAPATPDVIRTPIISPEGTVLAKPGWYEFDQAGAKTKMNLFLHPGDLRVPAVSSKATLVDLAKALALIEELIGEFKLCDLVGGGVDGKRASHANVVGMLLTLFMRWYIKGVTPLFLIEKPAEGVGATLLAEIVQLIFNGFLDAPTPYDQSESEMQKTMVSEMLQQKMILFFDNIESFSSRIVIQAITSDKVGGRVLGGSEMVQRDNRFLWVATGVNPQVSGEMTRRVCRIRMDAKTPDVQALVFNKADLKSWTLSNRGELVWALLTLATNWFSNGAKRWKGDDNASPLKSFEDWSEVIGGILAQAGITGFLANPRAASVGTREHEGKVFASEIFDWMGFKPKTFKELYDQSVIAEYEGVTGRDKAEKQKSLRKQLNNINFRPLNLFGHEVQLHHEREDLPYQFVKVDKEDE